MLFELKYKITHWNNIMIPTLSLKTTLCIKYSTTNCKSNVLLMFTYGSTIMSANLKSIIKDVIS